jgi:hypothetical protein
MNDLKDTFDELKHLDTQIAKQFSCLAISPAFTSNNKSMKTKARTGQQGNKCEFKDRIRVAVISHN